jgi:hypothetical protein
LLLDKYTAAGSAAFDHFRHPPRVKPPQRLELRCFCRREIGLAGRIVAAEPAQQIGADRRQ